MSRKILRVPNSLIEKIDQALADGKKIQAIKMVRLHANCGLKEAKTAIDRRQGMNVHSDTPEIVALVRVKSIKVDFGEGEVELDLEGFSMMTLMNMKRIGIEDTRRIIDLHDMIKEWQSSMDGFDPKDETEDNQ